MSSNHVRGFAVPTYNRFELPVPVVEEESSKTAITAIGKKALPKDSPVHPPHVNQHYLMKYTTWIRDTFEESERIIFDRLLQIEKPATLSLTESAPRISSETLFFILDEIKNNLDRLLRLDLYSRETKTSIGTRLWELQLNLDALDQFQLHLWDRSQIFKYLNKKIQKVSISLAEGNLKEYLSWSPKTKNRYSATIQSFITSAVYLCFPIPFREIKEIQKVICKKANTEPRCLYERYRITPGECERKSKINARLTLMEAKQYLNVMRKMLLTPMSYSWNKNKNGALKITRKAINPYVSNYKEFSSLIMTLMGSITLCIESIREANLPPMRKVGILAHLFEEKLFLQNHLSDEDLIEFFTEELEFEFEEAKALESHIRAFVENWVG